ncbi:MAG: DUF362 domain-containing protein [Spirochaetales bacterium]|nr:DUF362 domain-containing protein [Spirochaetales bacterium]
MENKATVAIVQCREYEKTAVYEAVKAGLKLLGGIKKILGKKKKILLKPNILHGDAPERCSATHPYILYGIGRVLKENGFSVVYGDSPAVDKTEWAVRRGGFAEIADELGIELADFSTGVEVKNPDAKQNKVFNIAKSVLECDAIINLPKMKTHGLTRMTGAIKNMFGVIPGLKKAWFHARIPDPEKFSQMIVDLHLSVKPVLNIMDAIFGMEGNGPRNGVPRHTGLLLFSADSVAIDATACRIMGISPGKVPLLQRAADSGLGHWQSEEIQLLGCPLEECRGKPYKVHPPSTKTFGNSPIQKHIKRLIIPRPVIKKSMCTKCGVCVKICPVSPKALTQMKGKQPEFDYNICIRCYCCQEVCPDGAISIKVPPLGVIFHGFGSRF